MPELTDTELLDGLQRLLQSGEEMIEFWRDPDANIFFAGDAMGDDLRGALTKLVEGANG